MARQRHGAGFRRLQADAPQRPGAVVVQQHVRRLLVVELAAAHAETAALGHVLDDGDAVQALGLEAIPGREQLRVALEQQVGQELGDLLFDQRVRTDRVARGQHQAVACQRDLRPQHARGIDQHDVLAEVELLLGLGDGRLVAHFRHPLLEQRVHQGRLADVRDAHDHDAQRLGRHAAVRRQRLADLRDARDLVRPLGRHRIGGHAFLGVIEGLPGRRRRRIGQVGLVQNLQARTLAELAQFLHQRVAARLGQAGVEDFDHQVGVLHLLGGFLLGRVHVPREPLYRHALLSKSSVRTLFYAGGRSVKKQHT